jgi:DNA-binding transcriptional MerR regulator
VTKGPNAFRTISEAAETLGVAQHVLRFWETKFTFISPTKRAGGRRFYRPQDIDLLLGVKTLLHDKGYTIRGVQSLFKAHGLKAITNPQHEVLNSQEVQYNPEAIIEPEALDANEIESKAVTDAKIARKLSQETRDSFLSIARMLETAQATLGNSLSKARTRGKFS